MTNFGPTGQLVWKPVPGFEGRYEVSNQGQVRSWARKGPADFRNSEPKLLKANPNAAHGYCEVTLFKPGGERVRYRLHRLVLTVFQGPCPEGYEGCHLNGDKTDNRVSNLMWKPHLDNIRDKYEHGTMFYGTRRDRRRKEIA